MPAVVCMEWNGFISCNSEPKLWRGHVPRYLPPVFDGVDSASVSNSRMPSDRRIVSGFTMAGCSPDASCFEKPDVTGLNKRL